MQEVKSMFTLLYDLAIGYVLWETLTRHFWWSYAGRIWKGSRNCSLRRNCRLSKPAKLSIQIGRGWAVLLESAGWDCEYLRVIAEGSLFKLTSWLHCWVASLGPGDYRFYSISWSSTVAESAPIVIPSSVKFLPLIKNCYRISIMFRLLLNLIYSRYLSCC